MLDVFIAREINKSYGKIPIFILCSGYKEKKLNGCEIITSSPNQNGVNPCISCYQSKISQLHNACKKLGLTDYLIENVIITDQHRTKINDIETTIFKRYRVSSMEELYNTELFPQDELLAEASVSASFYDHLKNICNRYNVEFASIFNGRFSPYKSILRFLTENNIPTAVHERGKSKGSFVFLKGMSVEHTDCITKALNKISTNYSLGNEEVNRLSK